MYEAFFGLAGKPFSTLPDPDFLLETGNHAQVFRAVVSDLKAGAALSLITSPTGCGKTTLVQRLIRALGDDVTVGLIPNTYRDLQDLPRWVLMSFDRKPAGSTPEATVLELVDFLAEEYVTGRRCLLIIDEAQNLAPAALEELHALAGVNADGRLLLQILLVGQTELVESLRHPKLEDLAKAVAARHQLEPLSPREVMLYIQRRLELVRAPRPLFDSVAIALIHYFSSGIPRLVNAISDLSLLYAFADGRRLVDADIVQAVVSDRKLTGLATFSNLERLEDPALVHEIRARFDLGETVPARNPAAEEQSERRASEYAVEVAVPAPEAQASDLLTDVPYSTEISDVDRPLSPEPLSQAPSSLHQTPNLHYLHPEMAADWPEIPGRAGMMRSAKPGQPAEPRRIGKDSTRASLRRRFLPRGESSEL